MCKKQTSVFTQFHRSWNHFSRCRFTHGWDSCSRSVGFSCWSMSFRTEPNQQNPRCKRVTVKLVGKQSTKHAETYSNHAHPSRSDQYWSRSIKRDTFWFQCYVVCLWAQWSREKMIMKGGNPTMRHVPRTHRVALDWLFDRINLDSNIQIRYIDTRHQLADILTKGNSTRDEWNNLLHLFFIRHFSSTCCAKNSSLTSCPKTMAKRMQEQKGEENNCGKIKKPQRWPCLHMFRQVPHPRKVRLHLKTRDTSHPQGNLKTEDKKFKIRRSVEFPSEAARCIPWPVDGHSNGETCRYNGGIRGCGPFRTWNMEAWRGRNKETRCLLNNYRENWSIEQTRKLVESQSWKKILAKQPTHFSSLSASHGCSLLDRKKHLWTRARGPSGGPGRERCYLGIFLNTTLQAAVNLGGDYEVNLRFVKNHLWNSVEQLFNETGASSPTRCFVWWKMGDDPIATWKSKIKLYSENNHFKDMNRIDGMRKEFEWEIFPGITTLALLEKIQSLMRDLQCDPEQFNDRIIFMSMYSDIAWGEKGNTERVWIQFKNICELCSQIPSRSLVFLGAWIRKEMVRNLHRQTRRILGPNGRGYDDEFHRFLSSNISCLQCLWEDGASQWSLNRLDIFWQKEEEPRKDFNIAWIQTLPINSSTFEQFKDIKKAMPLILSCKTMYCFQKDLLSTPTTLGTRVNWIP